MKRNSRIIHCLALLIASLFVMVSCGDGNPNPSPDILKQQSDVENDESLPDFYIQFSSSTPASSIVKEGQSFTLQIMNPSEIDQDIDVRVSYSGSGQYGQDFTFGGPDLQSISENGAVITISKELKMAEVTIDVNRDGVSEGNESVRVALEGATAVDGTEFTAGTDGNDSFSTTVIIESEDNVASIAKPQIEVSASKNRTVFIPVKLDLPAITETSFSYTIVKESGPLGVVDLYEDVTGGSITFQEGDNEKNIQINILDNAINTCQVTLRVILDPGGIVSDDEEIEVSANDDESVILVEGPVCAVPYCDSEGQDSSEEWLQRFVFGSIDNNSGNNGGYADFTNLSTSVQRGSAVGFGVQPGYSGIIYPESYNIWIDFNQDGDFDDAGENVLAACCLTFTGLATGGVAIPLNAELGSTRLRVTMKYNATANPCETFTFGEVEDYTVVITDSPSDADETPISGIEFTELQGDDDILFLRTNGESNQDKFDVLIKNIDTSEPIDIYNSANDLVKSVVAEGERTTINTSDLAKGTYTIKAKVDGKTISAEFVVQ